MHGDLCKHLGIDSSTEEYGGNKDKEEEDIFQKMSINFTE